MAEKRIYGRSVQKHDVQKNWEKATNFTPMAGEIVVYDRDENYDYERFKIGDGITNVNALPFAGGSVELDTTLTETGKAADAKAVGDALANISIVYEVNSAGVLYSSIGTGTAWIGMQDDSLFITQASSATLNNNELEVQ